MYNSSTVGDQPDNVKETGADEIAQIAHLHFTTGSASNSSIQVSKQPPRLSGNTRECCSNGDIAEFVELARSDVETANDNDEWDGWNVTPLDSHQKLGQIRTRPPKNNMHTLNTGIPQGNQSRHSTKDGFNKFASMVEHLYDGPIQPRDTFPVDKKQSPIRNMAPDFRTASSHPDAMNEYSFLLVEDPESDLSEAPSLGRPICDHTIEEDGFAGVQLRYQSQNEHSSSFQKTYVPFHDADKELDMLGGIPEDTPRHPDHEWLTPSAIMGGDNDRVADIFPGQGTGSASQPGNLRYLQKVRGLQPVYLSLEEGDFKGKTALALVVYNFVKEGGGRFLRKRSSQESHVVEMTKEESLEKIRRALRGRKPGRAGN